MAYWWVLWAAGLARERMGYRAVVTATHVPWGRTALPGGALLIPMRASLGTQKLDPSGSAAWADSAFSSWQPHADIPQEG